MGVIQAPEAVKNEYCDFSKIGKGGYGRVFKAKNKSSEKMYIKMKINNC